MHRGNLLMPTKTGFVISMKPKEPVLSKIVAKAKTDKGHAITVGKIVKIKAMAADQETGTAIVAAKASKAKGVKVVVAMVPNTGTDVPLRPVLQPLSQTNNFLDKPTKRISRQTAYPLCS